MIKGKESKPHIGIYGRCNSGKSTLLNGIVGFDYSIVSQQAGTTTDIVKISYEILGFSPVVFIDTAGIDDESEIGNLRVRRTMASLDIVDIGIIIFTEWSDREEGLCNLFREKSLPYILINNIISCSLSEFKPDWISLDVKNLSSAGRDIILDRIKAAIPQSILTAEKMFGDTIGEGDIVLLVCPIDTETPSGRLILPQVQAIRELLDRHAVTIVVQPEQIGTILNKDIVPKLVVTDSQLFGKIENMIPKGIELTSFSILLAKMKGDYNAYLEGLARIDGLKNGDKILILENCRHQTTCDDIGRVKIPSLLQKYCGCSLGFDFVPGLQELPPNIHDYALAVQCGGCMATAAQLKNRIYKIKNSGIPITNYGMCIKYVTGKLK
ncbi:MAG: [FeFe] hydrogenase H-cluster maturation GTPase HydF [Rikenellaceae bacterium]|nr:[FeFe] hydrogenase H-cluster maturation GTPase HydF [Rikenellaceae bacterium]